jgi:hypothetical protein
MVTQSRSRIKMMRLRNTALNTNAAELEPGSGIGHVAVKLPAIWSNEPELWFLQAESVFWQAKIKSSHTKYYYVLQQLPCEVLMSIKELARRIRSSAVDDPYKQLEAKLIASHQKSPWQKTFELLDMLDLGNRRLLALMDTMLALLCIDFVLCGIVWSQHKFANISEKSKPNSKKF